MSLQLSELVLKRSSVFGLWLDQRTFGRRDRVVGVPMAHHRMPSGSPAEHQQLELGSTLAEARGFGGESGDWKGVWTVGRGLQSPGSAGQTVCQSNLRFE